MTDYPDSLAIENKASFEKILHSDSNEPVLIINFLKFRPKALYDADRPEAALGLSGREAYHNFVSVTGPVLEERGACRLLLATDLHYAVGEGDWDAIWINHYPNAGVIAATVADQRLADVLYHRAAALERQHNVLARPTESLLAGLPAVLAERARGTSPHMGD